MCQNLAHTEYPTAVENHKNSPQCATVLLKLNSPQQLKLTKIPLTCAAAMLTLTPKTF